MSDHLARDYVSWLRLRRANVLAVATALADRAAHQNRAFSPGERAQFDGLNDALDHLDNKLRRAWIDRRADPSYRPSVNGWCRDNRGGSYAAAPGSGTRATFGALRAR